MRTRLLASLIMCAAIAGCGSSSSSSKSTSTSAPAPTSGGGTVQIKMQNIAFAPTSVTVKKGQKVEWVNEDTVDHNVTSSDGSIKSKDFGKGGTFTFTANKAGTIDYVCTIHPGMKATLTVQ